VVASSVVLIAEQVATAGRARGQGLGGIALGLGSGSCVILMPVIDGLGLSWRWLLVLAGGGLLILPVAAAKLRESAGWTHDRRRESSRTTLFGVFGRRLRGHSLPLLASGMLSTVAVTAATTWRYFHAVSVVGLSPTSASILLLGASGLALVGFPIGARACERFGRVPTVAAAALVMAAGIASSFWGPPSGSRLPLLWLGVGFLGFGVASNAMTVGGNCAATELIPATLRGTMVGWFQLVGSVGQVAAQSAMAVLAERLGGISPVIGWFGLLGVGVTLIFVLFVEETRGHPLPTAAPESDVAKALRSWTP
jgi:MFS family permease